MKHDKMDEIYKNIPIDKIPWNIETPPKELIDMSKSGVVSPCKTIDLGCGVGNYAQYFASIGFDVTGVDISGSAIKIASANAKKKDIKCSFLTVDVLGDLNEIKETFNFAYDWEMLHHIFPENRKMYAQNVNRLLNPKGKYLSVCFSEEDPQFGGTGKYRETKLGTTLYFSSEKELKNLFKPYFNIIEIKTIEIKGKFAPHIAIYAFMEKR